MFRNSRNRMLWLRHKRCLMHLMPCDKDVFYDGGTGVSCTTPFVNLIQVMVYPRAFHPNRLSHYVMQIKIKALISNKPIISTLKLSVGHSVSKMKLVVHFKAILWRRTQIKSKCNRKTQTKVLSLLFMD